MLEIMQWVAESPHRFIALIVILVAASLGSSLIIVAIGYAISLARGFDYTCEDKDEEGEPKKGQNL